MGDTTSALDIALQRLKNAQPKRLLVYLSDGEMKSVAVPERRTKWKTVRSTLEALSWSKIECLNAKGDVTSIIRNKDDSEGFAFGLEDLSGKDPSAILARLLGLMLKAMDVAVQRDSQRIELVLAHQTKLVEAVVSRLTRLERDRMDDLQLISDLMLARGDDDEDGMVSAKMLPMALQALRSLQSDPAPKPKPTKPAAQKPKPNGNAGKSEASSES